MNIIVTWSSRDSIIHNIHVTDWYLSMTNFAPVPKIHQFSKFWSTLGTFFYPKRTFSKKFAWFYPLWPTKIHLYLKFRSILSGYHIEKGNFETKIAWFCTAKLDLFRRFGIENGHFRCENAQFSRTRMTQIHLNSKMAIFDVKFQFWKSQNWSKMAIFDELNHHFW